jgi:hypothetical protein
VCSGPLKGLIRNLDCRQRLHYSCMLNIFYQVRGDGRMQGSSKYVIHKWCTWDIGIDELELSGVEKMYRIGVGMLNVPINEEYIPTPIILVTTWESSINRKIDPKCIVGSK